MALMGPSSLSVSSHCAPPNVLLSFHLTAVTGDKRITLRGHSCRVKALKNCPA